MPKAREDVSMLSTSSPCASGTRQMLLEHPFLPHSLDKKRGFNATPSIFQAEERTAIVTCQGLCQPGLPSSDDPSLLQVYTWQVFL